MLILGNESELPSVLPFQPVPIAAPRLPAAVTVPPLMVMLLRVPLLPPPIPAAPLPPLALIVPSLMVIEPVTLLMYVVSL